ncbi:MAG TPA: DUF4386 domain-containing protein [Rhizomicrobium sp.]
MTDRSLGLSPNPTARMAGFLYLITIVAGVFAQFYVGSALIVRNDAAATASHILASEALYRLGLAAELVGILAYVGVTALLYVLLRPVNRTLSVLAACFSLVGCAVGTVKLAFHGAPLFLLGGAHYSAGFTPDQMQALAYTFLKLEVQANNLGLICFGFYCSLIGWLVIRSTFFPRLLGVTMGIGGLCWLVNGFAILLAPALAAQIYPIIAAGILGEGSLCLGLMLAGVNTAKWRAQASATAEA